jgi:hypothetical protein
MNVLYIKQKTMMNLAFEMFYLFYLFFFIFHSLEIFVLSEWINNV